LKAGGESLRLREGSKALSHGEREKEEGIWTKKRGKETAVSDLVKRDGMRGGGKGGDPWSPWTRKGGEKRENDLYFRRESSSLPEEKPKWKIKRELSLLHLQNRRTHFSVYGWKRTERADCAQKSAVGKNWGNGGVLPPYQERGEEKKRTPVGESVNSGRKSFFIQRRSLATQQEGEK